MKSVHLPHKNKVGDKYVPDCAHQNTYTQKSLSENIFRKNREFLKLGKWNKSTSKLQFILN